ncbi:MAG TPA: glycosyltransferase family 4 protein [Steroidobacteraceae bacterium]|nr:glycosyltransferase family 4 protein [Steroidobacteraceae bacterium]
MRELRVGYVYENYSIRRNVLGAAPYCRYVQIGDWYRTLARAGRLLNRCAGRELLDVHDLAHQFRERRARPAVDLLHLFNQVSYGELPWVSSFETVLPRLRLLLDRHHGPEPSFGQAGAHPGLVRALAALAAGACRRLLALSQCSADMQRELLAAALPLGPREREAISAKTVVLPPPQARLIADLTAKPLAADGRLRLLFVGASFFRKGGVELLETLAALVHTQRLPLELTIVSSLALDGYAAGENAADQRRVRGLIQSNRQWIHHHDRLDNQAVLQLMRRADVGVLPTYADTYGFAALEFQAAGCPVISTDVRALPEINDDTRGWLIRVPKNRLGEALYTSAADRERLSRTIREGLARCITQIAAQPQLARIKGERALRALERHDPARIGERLFDIYMECAAARAAGFRASPTISS